MLEQHNNFTNSVNSSLDECTVNIKSSKLSKKPKVSIRIKAAKKVAQKKEGIQVKKVDNLTAETITYPYLDPLTNSFSIS